MLLLIAVSHVTAKISERLKSENIYKNFTNKFVKENFMDVC